MRSLPRVAMVTGMILLGSLFLFPMWRITLFAPQYPDGVTMYIHIDKIDGDSPGVLQNVNILNHYVGMKFIEPESIPELQYFPYIIMGMIALGLLTLIINHPAGYFGWAILMIGLAIIGIYDFYLWEYDYGHNLSPTAPIKIPGASFQPPVLGRKDILNFVAESFPALGGYLAGASIFMAGIAGWLRSKKRLS